MVTLRPKRSDRCPLTSLLRPLVRLNAVNISTASLMAKPLASPNEVERVTIAMPAAPPRAQVTHKSQNVLVRKL